MRFSEWLATEARLKGYRNIFNQRFPGMPKYVQNQIYNQILGPQMYQQLGISQNNTQTVDQAGLPRRPAAAQQSPMAQTINYTPEPHGIQPSDMFGQRDFLQDVSWMPNPTVLNLRPSDFDDNTISNFKRWRFGYAPDDHAVHRDSQRFAHQRNVMQAQQPGANEPVILLRNGNRYRLIDGAHRVMPRLVSEPNPNMGAAPDQVALVRDGGDINMLDLNRWRPVPINAYVGIKQAAADQQAA
jgi:hypothetical protein